MYRVFAVLALLAQPRVEGLQRGRGHAQARLVEGALAGPITEHQAVIVILAVQLVTCPTDLVQRDGDTRYRKAGRVSVGKGACHLL